ncbi:MAG: FeS-binding protein [Desulfuromonadales bacterium]|nr:FeS-binding protein [Desulfuromonadales bacterium]
MEEDCPFFPELYRLWDQEKETGEPISAADMRALVDLCTLCGLCPCPRIPMDLMRAKSYCIDKEGLPFSNKLLADVPRLAHLCGTFPGLVNKLLSYQPTSRLLSNIAKLHPDRQLPPFPQENFFQWARKKGLTTRREDCDRVTYFVGCTAGYLFPQIGQALVHILQHNGFHVYVPSQECCGMPNLMEGERDKTLQRALTNMNLLSETLDSGDPVISSCPTCGYYMKTILPERAYYSSAYQASVGAGEDEMKIPEDSRGGKKHKILKKSIYKEILKDDGYFTSLDPMTRIRLAEHFYDAGEYLARLYADGKFNTNLAGISGRMVYFAPCHQREQKIGTPYLDLLRLIPELEVSAVGGTNCCGMGGNFGYKAGFHEQSLAIGQPLIEKIRSLDPQGIITDCMSCRLQFNHALSCPVFHPLELLEQACR